MTVGFILIGCLPLSIIMDFLFFFLLWLGWTKDKIYVLWLSRFMLMFDLSSCRPVRLHDWPMILQIHCTTLQFKVNVPLRLELRNTDTDYQLIYASSYFKKCGFGALSQKSLFCPVILSVLGLGWFTLWEITRGTCYWFRYAPEGLVKGYIKKLDSIKTWAHDYYDLSHSFWVILNRRWSFIWKSWSFLVLKWRIVSDMKLQSH